MHVANRLSVIGLQLPASSEHLTWSLGQYFKYSSFTQLYACTQYVQYM